MNEIVVQNFKKWRILDVTSRGKKKIKLKEEELSYEKISSGDSQGAKDAEILVDDENTLIINENIKIIELMPYVFAKIREKDMITNDMIKSSLSPEFNRDQAFNAGEGQGKSGSFFFFSHDHKFIIKTMNDNEFKVLQSIVEDYLDHMIEHPKSLIARIYGVYTIRKEDIHDIHCILMGNTNELQNGGENLKYIFDLKGSMINRHVMMNIKNHKPGKVLKDINLLHIKSNETILKMIDKDVHNIIWHIERDVELFRKHNIMDYSLLFAIENNPYYLKYKNTAKRIIK
jgi:hypothetical protein